MSMAIMPAFVLTCVSILANVTLAGIGGGLFLWFNKGKFISLMYEPLRLALGDISALLMGCMLVIILSLIPMVAFDVVARWLREFGIDEAQIAACEREALNWALGRGSRSGRVAWQFARDYAGRVEPA